MVSWSLRAKRSNFSSLAHDLVAEIASSRFALRVMPKDSHLIERNAPLAREIRGDVRTPGHARVHLDNARHALLQPLRHLGKRKAQAVDDLEQREVRIGQPPAEEERAAALLDHLVEVAEEFRRAVLAEVLRVTLRLRLLLLVVERAADRMMRVVDLHHEVRDGKLQLVRP